MRSAAVLLLAGSLLSAQQSIDPKELHVSSAAYFPFTPAALHAEVSLVEVLAVVRDAQGHPVPNLTRGDFDLRDEGKKRELTAFSVQRAAGSFASTPNKQAAIAPTSSPAPQPASRTIAMLLDDVNSNAADFQHVRDAAARFVKSGLAPGDRIGLFLISGFQVVPFTTDADRLASAIAKLNPRTRLTSTSDCPQLTPYLAYLIANNLDRHALTAKALEMLQCDPASASTPPPPPPRGRAAARQPSWQTSGDDVPVEDPIALKVIRMARMIWNEQEVSSKDTFNVIQSVTDLLAAQPGQRMLLLGSGGFLAGSLQSQQETLINHALHAGVTINSLDAKGLYTADIPTNVVGGTTGRASIYAASLASRPQDATNEVLANLSDGTGGAFFKNSNDLDAGLSKLTEVPEVTYLLGFAPPSPDGKFHRLKVQVPSGKGYTVQARAGYMSEKEPSAEPRRERKIDREVFTTTQAHDSPVALELTSQPSGSGGSVLQAAFHADVRTLPFIEKAGVRTEKLWFLMALLDDEGNFIAGKEGGMDFALQPETFDRLRGTRLDADLKLDMPPAGQYRLRVLIEEGNHGEMTEATQVLELK